MLNLRKTPPGCIIINNGDAAFFKTKSFL